MQGHASGHDARRDARCDTRAQHVGAAEIQTVDRSAGAEAPEAELLRRLRETIDRTTAGVDEMSIGERCADFEHFGGGLNSASGKKTQVDDAGFLGVDFGEPLQGVVQFDEVYF